MESVGFILASIAPLILLGLRGLVLRHLSAGRGLALDAVLLLVSFPLGAELIGRISHFPANVGDHSPGFGIALAPLMAVWLLCALIWMARLAWYVFRKLSPAR